MVPTARPPEPFRDRRGVSSSEVGPTWDRVRVEGSFPPGSKDEPTGTVTKVNPVVGSVGLRSDVEDPTNDPHYRPPTILSVARGPSLKGPSPTTDPRLGSDRRRASERGGSRTGWISRYLFRRLS